jgi:predicted nuclease of predicted toxin-antitoxin system
VRLLLDEMYPAALAEHLRARGHDVVSVHDPDYSHLEGVPDVEVFAAAIAAERALLTENVADFRRLETDALGRDAACPRLIFTTNGRFLRGQAATLGRLVRALDAALAEPREGSASFFLEAGGS